MSEVKTGPQTIHLTPESGIRISQDFADAGYSVYGHGTPSTDPFSFFRDGINTALDQMGSYSSVSNIAIPLTPASNEELSGTIADLDFMNKWPHQRGLTAPSVVLLAIPNPVPELGVVASGIEGNLIDEEKQRLDTRFVYGFYSPESGEVTINPAFKISKETHAQEIEAILQSLEEIRKRPLPFDIIGDVALLPTVTTPPTVEHQSEDDLPLVW